MSVVNTVGSSLAEGWWMFYDTLWALVLGFALSGAVQAFVSRTAMQRSLGDHRPQTIAKASFFGMVSSSCSYAASALAKSLFARGADFTASMTFMFASTNLVVELGLVLWLLIGWQFALAEFVGGAVMIVLLALVLPRVLPLEELDRARERLGGNTNPSEQDDPVEADASSDGSLGRARTRAGWADAAGYTVSDVTMLRKELVIGFVVAGFASMAVPVSVWQALFLTGHGLLSTIENVVVAPVLAFISFVCSVGNVPLAAALWKGGISFGGVIAFIFADLLALPLVLIYRKFYGTRLAVRLALVFWAVMSLAGLITEEIFLLLSLTPSRPSGEIAATHVGLNYTTVLNLIAVGAFGYLYWLYRNRERFGGGDGLAKDVVCGMQVRTSDAPAQALHHRKTFYFCSDGCHDRFVADPERFERESDRSDVGAAVGHPPEVGSGADAVLTTDPVCRMSVDAANPPARVEFEDHHVGFCSDGCRETFLADPMRYAADGSNR
ncbi:hypothetical protein GCM10027596_39610 [Nocardioides korecus]